MNKELIEKTLKSFDIEISDKDWEYMNPINNGLHDIKDTIEKLSNLLLEKTKTIKLLFETKEINYYDVIKHMDDCCNIKFDRLFCDRIYLNSTDYEKPYYLIDVYYDPIKCSYVIISNDEDYNEISNNNVVTNKEDLESKILEILSSPYIKHIINLINIKQLRF